MKENLSSHKKIIADLIADGDLERAIRLTLALTESLKPDLSKQVILLSYRLNTFEKATLHGRINGWETEDIARTKLAAHLLSLLDGIPA